MKKVTLSPKWKKWLISAHVLCMIAWFGGTLSLLTLNLISLRAGSLSELSVTDQNLQVIDEVFVKFPAMGTLITGLLLALWTNWGLTTYYWVMFKEVLTVAIIAFGIFGMNRWSGEISALIASQGWDIIRLPLYVQYRGWVLNGAIANCLGLALIVIVTYLKPWGKRRPKST